MARKPSVTRTIKTTKCNVLCMNLETSEPFNTVISVPRTYTDEKKLYKAVEDVINTETTKAVHIVDRKEEETLYGMSEQDFIKYANILDNETRKPIEETETEE